MSELELVNMFNAELSSLYDVKPPISKGKMTAVTKAALKAVKLYKHIVQSVEKFIQKCKPEYKVPGLYVIDSIIRQSRHQYGAEKDIFSGRFARNLQATFYHIYRCPEEDRAKVIRVLNLWQKNKVFNPEVIAPLFDLADPSNPIWEAANMLPEFGLGNNLLLGGGGLVTNNSDGGLNSIYLGEVQFKSHLLDYDYDEDPDDAESKSSSGQPSIVKPGSAHQPPPPPIIRNESSTPTTSSQHASSSITGIDALGSLLNNPEVLRQLQTLQEQMTAAATAQAHQQPSQIEFLTPDQERQRKLAELNKQEAAFDQKLAETLAKTQFAVECEDFIEENKVKSPNEGNSAYSQAGDQNSNQLLPGTLAPPPFFQQLHAEQGRLGNPFGLPLTFPLIANQIAAQQQQSDQVLMCPPQLRSDGNGLYQTYQHQPPLPFDSHIQSGINEDKDSRNHRDRDERDRDRRRRKSRRSRSNDSRSGRSRRSRSSSRNLSSNRTSSRRHRSRSRERREEKERQRKGFGAIRRDHLSVCSTTLWVGHLSKLVSQEELSDTFGQYGDIVSIEMIQSRGCAFVVMNRRQDAVRALDRLRKTKLQGKEITLAWAPGKGVKGRDWKDYWEVDSGISYIPWNKLSIETDLDEFEHGGCVDESTLPDFLKNLPKKEKGENVDKKSGESTDANHVGESTTMTVIATIGPNGVDKRPEIVTGPSPLPVPAPLPPVLPNPPPYGMPPPVGMLGVPPGMMGPAMNMMLPPPLMGGPMGLPPLPGVMMSMMGPPGPIGLTTNDSPVSQMKPGLLGDMPILNPSSTDFPMMSQSNIDEEDVMGGDESRKRSNSDHQRRGREKKRSRFENADKFSPTTAADEEEHDQSEPPQMDQQRSDEPIFDRLKSLADGYSFNASNGGNVDGIKLNSLLGPPIGPPSLLGNIRGPNNFRGGFRPPFMNDRGGGNRPPWFDGNNPGPGASLNPFMNPGQNPFGSGGPPPFLANNENPFHLDGLPPNRRPPRDRGNGGSDYFGGAPLNDHFNNNKRGGWRDGPPGLHWRGRGGGPPIRGGRGGGRGGTGWRPPKPHHNFVVKNS